MADAIGTPTADELADGPRVAWLRPGWGLAIAVWAIYTVGMAGAWMATDNTYDDIVEVNKDMWWVTLILVILMLGLVWLSGLRVQRSWRLGWLSLVLIVPVGVSLLGAALAFADKGTNWMTVLFVLGATLLVGIGEETAFRGLVLNSLARRIPVIGAVIVSGVLFGLMHSVNAMLQPVGTTVWQVVVTSMMGIVFGFVYVSSGGNLVLCIVLHWMYDFSLMAPQATAYGSNPIGIIGLLMVVAFLIAVPIGIVKYRSVKRWPTAAPTAPTAAPAAS